MVLKPYLESIERDECRVILLPANKMFGAEKEKRPVQVNCTRKQPNPRANPVTEAARLLF